MSNTRNLSQEFEQWSIWTKQDIKEDKGTIVILNALSVVAAFIAGVQGQILTICLNANLPNQSAKKRASICAFIGLLLDILGASIGVIHTLLLKQRVNDNAQILSLLATFRDEANVVTENASKSLPVQNIQEQVEIKMIQGNSDDGRRQRLEDFAYKMQGRYQRHRLADSFDRVTNILDYSSGPFEVISAVMTLRFWVSTLMVSQRTSSVPLVAMAVGVGSLSLSVIFLAEGVAGISSGEFIACVVVIAAVFLSLWCTFIMKFYIFLLSSVRDFIHRRRGRHGEADVED